MLGVGVKFFGGKCGECRGILLILESWLSGASAGRWLIDAAAWLGSSKVWNEIIKT